MDREEMSSSGSLLFVKNTEKKDPMRIKLQTNDPCGWARVLILQRWKSGDAISFTVSSQFLDVKCTAAIASE